MRDFYGQFSEHHLFHRSQESCCILCAIIFFSYILFKLPDPPNLKLFAITCHFLANFISESRVLENASDIQIGQAWQIYLQTSPLNHLKVCKRAFFFFFFFAIFYRPLYYNQKHYTAFCSHKNCFQRPWKRLVKFSRMAFTFTVQKPCHTRLINLPMEILTQALWKPQQVWV